MLFHANPRTSAQPLHFDHNHKLIDKDLDIMVKTILNIILCSDLHA